MKRETLSEALSLLSERHINDAALFDPGNIQEPPERTEEMNSKRSIFKTVCIAAVVAALLAMSVFAISYFSMHGRSAYDGEKYRISWGINRSSFMEWTDLKYVLEFEGAEECNAVQFKEGWLPFAPNEKVNAYACDAEGWRSRLVSETAPEVDSYSDNYQPYMVEVYYAPQFLNDGALLLLDQTPVEIIEEQWGEERVMKFEATHVSEAVDNDALDIHIPAKTMHYYFVLRFHPEKGYILVTSGTSDMETVEHIARELQVRETDRVIHSSDFENNCTFIDVSQG